MLAGGNYEIFVANGDGSDPVNLTQDPAGDFEPSWSPDGDQIAFSRSDDFRGQIFVMNSDGSAQRNISSNTCGDSYPSWSPDGSTILFYRINKPGCVGQGIFLMDSDGSNVRQAPGLDKNYYVEPSWSPDGSKILFTDLFSEQGYEITVINADGTNQRNISHSFRNDSQARWSPDGTAIAFVGDRTFNQDIYTMAPDGTNQVDLTNCVECLFEVDPAWSGDGTAILFTRYHNIYVMNRDGTNVRPLIAGRDVVAEGATWFGPGAPPTPSPAPTASPTPTASPIATPVSPSPSAVPTAAILPITGGTPDQSGRRLTPILIAIASLAAMLSVGSAWYIRRR
jgi:TolB protein